MSSDVSEGELARLREAARLLAEGVRLDTDDNATDEQLDEYAEALARWLSGVTPELRELEKLRAEHAYLVGMASPDDLRIMRQELAHEHDPPEATA